MKREIQKISRRQESPTAAISRPAFPENRGREVTFADDGQTAMRRERSRERYFPRGQKNPRSFGPPRSRFNHYQRYGQQYSQSSPRNPRFGPRGWGQGEYAEKYAFPPCKTALCRKTKIQPR